LPVTVKTLVQVLLSRCFFCFSPPTYPLKSRNIQNITPANQQSLFYYAFDLLHLDGKDLLEVELIERMSVVAIIDGGVCSVTDGFARRLG